MIVYPPLRVHVENVTASTLTVPRAPRRRRLLPPWLWFVARLYLVAASALAAAALFARALPMVMR